MKKLRIKCCSTEIIFATDSEKIYNYFLTDEEQVPETIPGIEIIPDEMGRFKWKIFNLFR